MRAKFKGTVFEPLIADKEFEKQVKAEYGSLTVGEMITEAMELESISKVELARRMHTSPAAITRYTRPDYDKFKLDTLAAIAQAMGGELTVSFKLPSGKGGNKKKVLSSMFTASRT